MRRSSRPSLATCPAARCRCCAWQVAGTGPALGRLLPELAARLPEFSAAGDGDAEGDRHRLFVVTGSLLAAMATTSPLLLVIDDLQWAGEGALLLLRYAARALASVPLLIIAAYRPEETTGVPVFGDVLADLVGEPGVIRVEVGRLSDAAGEQLVRETVGDDLPGPLAARLHEDAAGNPLFLTELLRELQQEVAGRSGRRIGSGCRRQCRTSSRLAAPGCRNRPTGSWAWPPSLALSSPSRPFTARATSEPTPCWTHWKRQAPRAS